MLELIHIQKSYQTALEGQSLCVLKDITLKVSAGQSIAIVGPSGSGKSTLLNILGALDKPSSGRVLFDDTDLGQFDERQLAKIRNEQIGFVFQLHHLLPQCTVLENVLIPTLVSKKPDSRKAFEQRAVSLLERVGLKDWLYHRPGELSGGQRQRVAVVRALINNPRILLADEPTGSLDTKAAETIAALLVELNQSEKVTLIVATHSGRLAERMSEVLELDDGELTERKNR
ncbi:MAG: ABC transporter ATP-binding protein [Planctomycetota bacterium]|jgi:ABC-type lipoprotein export system ATPase subunit